MTAADWIDDLERKAKAATPGPWNVDHSEEDNSAVKQEGRAWWDGLAFCRRPADAKFIAAADPDTILRLIKQAQNYNAEADRHASRVVALEAENEDLTAERDALAARLAAVEARIANAHAFLDAEDAASEAKGRQVWSIETSLVRAALAAPTDTTKEN